MKNQSGEELLVTNGFPPAHSPDFIGVEEQAGRIQRLLKPPKEVEETGLKYDMIEGLLLKHMLLLGEFKNADVVSQIKLPALMVEHLLDNLRKNHFVEVKGAANYSSMAYEYRLTDLGHEKANQHLEFCRYVGPVPIPLDKYSEMVKLQTIKQLHVTEEQVKKVFSHLVMPERKIQQFGLAMSSGQSMFIFGPPGSGKSTIAEAISTLLTDSVYIPYAVLAGEQIINLYDPVRHELVAEDDGTQDHRWLKVRRPVVMTGGELSMRMLNLEFNTISKYYEASLQMIANNGLLVIDDFGRQQVEPQRILNRWLVPLDRRIDYITLHTGLKLAVPFDMLMIIATNIEPQKLLDDTFQRRILYKIKIEHPSAEEFKGIFKSVCSSNDLLFDQQSFDYLVDQFYLKRQLSYNASHPRDIVSHVINYSRYYNQPLAMNLETIQNACENYFVTQ